MGMDVGKKGGVKADINVTPLVDIVLVLLIIFIVITPAVNNAVQLPLSKQSIKQDVDPSSKYLSLILTATPELDANGKPVVPLRYIAKDVQLDDTNIKDEKTGEPLKFSFDNQQKHREQLVNFVKKNVDGLRVDKRVFIKADSKLPFGFVNELFQICREAGADEASVVTSEDKGKDKS